MNTDKPHMFNKSLVSKIHFKKLLKFKRKYGHFGTEGHFDKGDVEMAGERKQRCTAPGLQCEETVGILRHSHTANQTVSNEQTKPGSLNGYSRGSSRGIAGVQEFKTSLGGDAENCILSAGP